MKPSPVVHIQLLQLPSGPAPMPPYDLHMFVPVMFSLSQKVFFLPEDFDKNVWPGCYGIWHGSKIWGTPEWDGEKLTIEWSDGDKTSLDLRNGMELKLARIVTFSSERDVRKYEFRIVLIEVL